MAETGRLNEIGSSPCNDLNQDPRALANKHTIHRLQSRPKHFIDLLRSLLLLSIAAFAASFSTIVARERLPPVSTFPPLPDLVLDQLPCVKWAIYVTHSVMLTFILAWVGLLVVHRHRRILFQRFAILTSLLYLLRIPFFLVTALPATSKCSALPCEPLRLNGHWQRIGHALTNLFGLSTVGFRQQECGDYFYSGHSSLITLLCLLLIEYTPAKWWLVHWSCVAANCLALLGILAFHAHYTVDVLMAILITLYVFHSYHLIAQSGLLRRSPPTRSTTSNSLGFLDQGSRHNDDQQSTRVRRRILRWMPFISTFETGVGEIDSIDNSSEMLDCSCIVGFLSKSD